MNENNPLTKENVIPVKQTKSQSLLQRRFRKFRSLKRGYYSFLLLTSLFTASFFFPLLINDQALVVRHQGELYFPAFRSFAVNLPIIGFAFDETPYRDIFLKEPGVSNFRELKATIEREGRSDDWVLLTIYPFSAMEDVGVAGNQNFIEPFEKDANGYMRACGTDDRGRDVFARMLYGFNISISFAFLLAIIQYIIGVPLGAMLGFFGGKFDLLMQRVIEIWGTLPMLFLIIIVVSIIRPNFLLFIGLLSLVSWVSLTILMRAEFYREKAKDYVAAAVSIGVPTKTIIIRHILPNALIPIITFFPFSVVGGITALVSLDFLGFGLPPPTPSWGEMMSIGLENLLNKKWWLIVVPLLAMFSTLLCTVFIGEGVREAFDPKTYSRLR